MFILLIGFITPAIIFAIFGILACLRRAQLNSSENEDDKDYLTLETASPRSINPNFLRPLNCCVTDTADLKFVSRTASI